MHPAISLLKKAGTTNILSDRVTMEYVLEKLSEGFPRMSVSPNGASPGAQVIKLGFDAAALLVSTELSVFITASQFSITCLSDLWDSKEGVYQYGTRGKGEWNINEPIVSLLGGSAQNWLVKSVALRLFLIYHDSCDPNDFDDEASSVYKTSKWANAGKLAEVLSLSRSDSLVINELDLQQAIDKVEDVAKDLKIVFRAVGESDLASASDRVIRFLETRGFASRGEILQFNWRNFTSNELDVIIATFRESGMIGEKIVGNKTLYYWKDSTKP